MVKKEEVRKGFGIAGFVLSLCAVIFFWIPFVGFILAILGIIFSAIQMKKNSTGLAIAGLILGIIGILIGAYYTFAIFSLIGGFFQGDKIGINQSVVLVTTSIEYSSGNLLYEDTFGGSGVIITKTPDLIRIITNRHVMDCYFGGYDCGKMISQKTTVMFYDGKIYNVSKVYFSPNSLDLAILELEIKNSSYNAVKIAAKLKSGESVIAIGYPGFSENTREFWIRGGKITGFRDLLTDTGFSFQAVDSNAYINFGSSGGGLFNSKGELVGITTWKDALSTYAISSKHIGSIEEYKTCKKNYYLKKDSCLAYYCPWVLENFECVKPCEDFYCESEELYGDDNRCEDPSQILGNDNFCHYPCGSSKEYCVDQSSYCFKNECLTCPYGYTLFKNGLCYTPY